MPLYGHELGEDINPAQADLGFAISLKDREFIGRETIVAARSDESLPVRIGLQLAGRRAAREDCPILDGDQQIGKVTSGTFSPTFEKPIAMGYVSREHSAVGNQLEIDIRGKRHPATVVDLPFYQRPK